MKKLLLISLLSIFPSLAYAGFTTNDLTATETLTVPHGTSPDSLDCDDESERGRIFVDTNATSGRQIYGCEGASGWILQGDGNTGGGGSVTTIAVEDGGSLIVNTSTINFTGSEFTITDDSGEALVKLNQSSVTLQGNSFNGANQLLQADSNGLIPNADIDSSSVTKVGPTIEVSELSNVNAGTDLTADLEEETHVSEHQNGGADELDVSGLSGLLADTQNISFSTGGTQVSISTGINFIQGSNVQLTGTETGNRGDLTISVPTNAGTDITADLEEETHVSEHQNGGADEISVTGLSGLLADNQYLAVSTGTTLLGNTTHFTFVAGSNMSIVADVGSSSTTFRFNSTAAGGSGTTIEIEDGGSSVVATSTINFTGTEFIVTNDGGEALVKLDQSSVTLQGNTFNGANQLLQADANGLIPNADIDSSSVTKVGPTIEVAEISNVNAGTNLTADLEEETHVTEHQNGGADEINVAGLSGLLADNQYLAISTNTTLLGNTTHLTFIAGSNMSITADVGSSSTTLRFASTASGGSGTTISVEDGGSAIVNTSTLNFTGAQFIITDDSGEALVALNPSSVTLLGASGGDTNAIKLYSWSGASLLANRPQLVEFDGVASTFQQDGTTVSVQGAGFDDSDDECRGVQFIVPEDIDTTGTAEFYVNWYSSMSTSGSAQWYFAHIVANEGENWDQSLTEEDAASDAVQGTVKFVTETTWTETLSNLTWTAEETVVGYICRDGDGDKGTDDMTGDARLLVFGIGLPRR